MGLQQQTTLCSTLSIVQPQLSLSLTHTFFRFNGIPTQIPFTLAFCCSHSQQSHQVLKSLWRLPQHAVQALATIESASRPSVAKSPRAAKGCCGHWWRTLLASSPVGSEANGETALNCSEACGFLRVRHGSLFKLPITFTQRRPCTVIVVFPRVPAFHLFKQGQRRLGLTDR